MLRYSILILSVFMLTSGTTQRKETETDNLAYRRLNSKKRKR